MKLHHALARAAVVAAVAVSSMAMAADKDAFEQRADKLRAGPASAPTENETGFSSGLKCMDGLFRNFGIKNVTVVIDEIPDATKKVNVGARDMFMSATSQMTRTTHAIRLVPMVESRIFTESKRERVVADADFVIQGSISQFDDSVLQKQRDGAVCLWYLCVGAAESDAFSGLGLDLNLVETTGLSLVPGANVRNAVLIRKRGKGYDGDLTLRKFSVQYNFTLVSHDGNGQALRTLIELFGRLLKLPYWSCIGATDQDPEVRAEIDDWWEELAGDPNERGRLFAYLQMQMKAQGVYDGEVNGRIDQPLLRAVRAYRMALGQPDDLNLDAAFLRKYLEADQAEVRKIAASNLADIAIKEGPLPEPVAQNTAAAPPPAQVAQAAPPAGPAAPAPQQQVAQASASAPAPQPARAASAAAAAPAPQQVAQAPAAQPARAASTPAAAPAPQQVAQAAAPAAQPVKPASTPAAAPAPQQVAQAAATRPVAAAGVAASSAAQPAATSVQEVAYRPAQPVAHIPIEGSRPANNSAYKAGEPFFVGVISPHDGYLYCYLIDDQQHVSQFFPAPAQSPSRVSGGTLTVVNSTSPLVASHPPRREEVACFTSPKDLGRQPLDPTSVLGLDALKTRFAIAVSGGYAMGVFDVKVQ
jgi:hypothetical protein